jgi:undecaprenyl-diphosphatase
MDLQILLFLQNHVRVSWLDPIMKALSVAGNAGLCWIILGLALLAWPKTRRTGFTMLAAMAVCYVFNDLVVKLLVQRPRPFTVCAELHPLVALPASWSFPSGHTCSSFAAACSIYRTNGRRAGIPAFLVAAGIGFSRMYVGVHYPTDVLCGMLIGIFGSWAVWKGLWKWEWYRKL